MDALSDERWADGDDDLARQRRKRAARQLSQPPEGRGGLDVRGYMAARGHHPGAIEAVVDQLLLGASAHPSLATFEPPVPM
jgi:hypothetical protein